MSILHKFEVTRALALSHIRGQERLVLTHPSLQSRPRLECRLAGEP